MAAILLAQSTTLRLATGIANIAARAPSAMAAGRRRLDEAYPGRFVLGLGVSHDSIIDAYAGRSWAAPWQRSSATWPECALERSAEHRDAGADHVVVQALPPPCESATPALLEIAQGLASAVPRS